MRRRLSAWLCDRVVEEEEAKSTNRCCLPRVPVSHFLQHIQRRQCPEYECLLLYVLCSSSRAMSPACQAVDSPLVGKLSCLHAGTDVRSNIRRQHGAKRYAYLSCSMLVTFASGSAQEVRRLNERMMELQHSRHEEVDRLEKTVARLESGLKVSEGREEAAARSLAEVRLPCVRSRPQKCVFTPFRRESSSTFRFVPRENRFGGQVEALKRRSAGKAVVCRRVTHSSGCMIA